MTDCGIISGDRACHGGFGSGPGKRHVTRTRAKMSSVVDESSSGGRRTKRTCPRRQLMWRDILERGRQATVCVGYAIVDKGNRVMFGPAESYVENEIR